MKGFRRSLKLYLDTSVPNFLFAEDAKEKQALTQALFTGSLRRDYEFCISGVVLREIGKAPPARRHALELALKGLKVLEFTEEAEALATQYLRHGALPEASVEDARHVAVATVHNLDAVVSWNFKHLVNLKRIKAVNLVNESTNKWVTSTLRLFPRRR